MRELENRGRIRRSPYGNGTHYMVVNNNDHYVETCP